MKFRTINRTHFLKYAVAILFAITLVRQFNAIISLSSGDIKKFFAAKGHYSKLRNSYTTFALTAKAKKAIDPRFPVTISYSSLGVENVGARYSLYPLKLNDNGVYLIDLARSVKDTSAFAKKKKLSSDVFIFTDEHHSFLPEKKVPYPSLFKMLLVFFSSVIFHIVIGMLFLCFLRFPLKKEDAVWTVTISYLAGFCILTTSLWLLLLLGVSLKIKTLIILGISIICVLLLLSFKNKITIDWSFYPEKTHDLPEKILRLFAAVLVTIIILWIVSNPVKDWDTMSNWAIKSKVIFHEQSLDLRYTFNNHNSYPILWPLHIAAEFTLLKGDYDEVALWSSALFFLILLSQLLKGFSLMEAKPFFATICLLAYIAYFSSENPTISAMPENAFLCFLTGLIVSVCLWLKSPKDKCYLGLSIILAMGLNLLKLEGAVATVMIVCSLIIVKKREILTRTTGFFILALLSTTILPVFWVYWTKWQGFSSGVFHLQNAFSLDKFIFLMGLNAKYFVQHGEYLIFFFGLAYFAFFPNPRKWNTSEKFLLSLSVFLIIFKWFATLGWDKELTMDPGVFPDALWRLFLHAGPSLILLFCSRAFHKIRA